MSDLAWIRERIAHNIASGHGPSAAEERVSREALERFTAPPRRSEPLPKPEVGKFSRPRLREIDASDVEF